MRPPEQQPPSPRPPRPPQPATDAAREQRQEQERRRTERAISGSGSTVRVSGKFRTVELDLDGSGNGTVEWTIPGNANQRYEARGSVVASLEAGTDQDLWCMLFADNGDDGFQYGRVHPTTGRTKATDWTSVIAGRPITFSVSCPDLDGGTVSVSLAAIPV